MNMSPPQDLTPRCGRNCRFLEHLTADNYLEKLWLQRADPLFTWRDEYLGSYIEKIEITAK